MSTASKERRKSDKGGMITLTVPPSKLRALFKKESGGGASVAAAIKDEDSVKASPAPSANGAHAAGATLSALPSLLNDNGSESTPNTPADSSSQQEGTPAPGVEGAANDAAGSSMAPPSSSAADAAGGSKKKGVKRSAAAAGVDANGDATPKARSKPGPKKKQKLDDTFDAGRNIGGAHKLGPKASMGAINAGLRALDRSGKPCRKWNKGSFKLKTFTGVVWEIPRWTAPQRAAPADDASADASTSATEVSASGSNKENGTVAVNGVDKKGKDSKEKKDKMAPAAEAKESGPKVNGTANGHLHAESETGKGTSTDGDIEMQSAPSAQPSPPPSSAAGTASAVAVAVA